MTWFRALTSRGYRTAVAELVDLSICRANLQAVTPPALWPEAVAEVERRYVERRLTLPEAWHSMYDDVSTGRWPAGSVMRWTPK